MVLQNRGNQQVLAAIKETIMKFTNIDLFTSRQFGDDSQSDLKCPVCGNSFLIGVNTESNIPDDVEIPNDLPCLLHVPYEFEKYNRGKPHTSFWENFIFDVNFHCPFLIYPMVLCECPPPYKDNLVASYKEFFMKDAPRWVIPTKVVRESVKQYSRMMKLNKTVCKYCGEAYELSCNIDKKRGKEVYFQFGRQYLSCNFGCKCVSVKGAMDLSHLALDFMRRYDKKMAELSSREELTKSSTPKAPTKRSIPKASSNSSTPVVESNYIISHMPNGYIVFN